MRFLLKLEPINYGKQCLLPINYQYELASCIYQIISSSSQAYSEWLHKNGFQTENRQYRLFTFSNFNIPEYKIIDDRIQILSRTITCVISFLPERSTAEFINGVFSRQQLSIGDRKTQVDFRVVGIELLPEPNFELQQNYETLSPVCIKRHLPDENRVIYESPESENFAPALLNNLLNKYKAFNEVDFPYATDFEFGTIGKTRSKLISIKANTPQETKVRGYSFRFRIKAHPELLRIMYHCGLGEMNAMGFGCVEKTEFNQAGKIKLIKK